MIILILLSLPFVMNPQAPEEPAGNGDNTLDTVEQIVLPQLQTGVYTIQVSIKNSLQTAEQAYSLISDMALERTVDVMGR